MIIRKVALTSVCLLALSALTACGSASAGPQETSPPTFEASGKLESYTIRGADCTSQNARALKTGDQIKIQAKGNTVAMGEVGTAVLEDRSPNNGYVCVFDFKVSDVPAGEGFYKVVVENQGDKEVTEEDLKAGTFAVNTVDLDNPPAN